MSIWVISDLHLGHANIIRYCNRPFETVEQMNRTIIDNWNSVVHKDDIVYFLGDFCFGRPGNEVSRSYRSMLNGTIHLIRGNHDKFIDESIFESVQDELYLDIDGKKIYLCHYPDRTPDHFDLYLYGHVHDKWTPKPKYHCVCVENTNYFPVNIYNLI
jgi:calcineurin-like phosphoesterase family protein